MRDTARIEPLLQHLRAIWLQYPELRFVQLVLNVLRGEARDYYMEDAELVARLRDRYSVEPADLLAAKPPVRCLDCGFALPYDCGFDLCIECQRKRAQGERMNAIAEKHARKIASFEHSTVVGGIQAALSEFAAASPRPAAEGLERLALTDLAADARRAEEGVLRGTATPDNVALVLRDAALALDVCARRAARRAAASSLPAAEGLEQHAVEIALQLPEKDLCDWFERAFGARRVMETDTAPMREFAQHIILTALRAVAEGPA